MRVVTHNGVFHADEVCAVALLALLAAARGEDLEVERTRDPGALKAAVADPTAWVVDVGGVYDPAALNFDHHMRGGAGPVHVVDVEPDVMSASFGLVFAAVADEVVGKFLSHQGRGLSAYVHVPEEGTCTESHRVVLSDGVLPSGAVVVDMYAVIYSVYRELVIPVDANDVGRGPWGPLLAPFSRVIGGYNPSYWETSAAAAEGMSGSDSAVEAVLFLEAVEAAARAIVNAISHAAGVELAKERFLATPVRGGVLTLREFLPWKPHVRSHAQNSELLFVVHPGQNDDWVVLAVQDYGINRRAFPEAWAGLTGEALAEASGVADAKFCHNARFIASAASREGAIALAKRAIDA